MSTPNFDVYGNFIKYGKHSLPFDSIIFGANSRILEAELNDMQTIINSKFSKLIKALEGGSCWIPPSSDITKAFGITTTSVYLLQNSYILDTTNGFVIMVGSNIEINLASSLQNTGDTTTICAHIEPLILDYNDNVAPFGSAYNGTTNLENMPVKSAILDPRMNFETSRRVGFRFSIIEKNVTQPIDGNQLDSKYGEYLKECYIPICTVTKTDTGFDCNPLCINSTASLKVDINRLRQECKAYVDDEIANLVGTAPENLDTLNELAKALTDNAEVLEVLNNAVTSKANKDGSNATGTWGISITGNAKTSTKATQDANGNVINETYATKTETALVTKTIDSSGNEVITFQ